MRITKQGTLPPTRKQVNILIHYALYDQNIFRSIEKHFSSNEYIAVIDSNKFIAGSHVEEEQNKKIKKAHSILLLLSPDYFGDDIIELEMEHMLFQRKDLVEKGLVFLLIIRPVLWKDTMLNGLPVILDGKYIRGDYNQMCAVEEITRRLVQANLLQVEEEEQ